tara:strand:- start:5416 stop:6129 length:714 start_codon:yes stop_codon:yes gene_type:complete
MQLTLTFDIGNTNPHAGWFIDGELKQVTPIAKVSEQSIDAVGARKVKAVTSKVGANFNFSWLEPVEVTQWRTLKDFLGMPIKYAGTLGADRLVQVFYLHHKRQQKQILIDAGTFTTIDFLSEHGHEGGIIIPGIETYLDVFKLKGAKLPRLSADQVEFDKPENIHALSTYEAIAEGYKLLMNSIANKVHGPDMHNVILTGGHGERLKPLFPRHTIEPHLIHHSLFHALESAQKLGIT